MSQSNAYLFVYGTLLRQSQSPVSSMLSKHSSFIEKGTVRGLLYDIGEYPGLVVNDDSKDEVLGEVFKLKNPSTLLKKLDSYEGPEYKRIKAHVYLDNGDHLSAWVYNFTNPRTALDEQHVAGLQLVANTFEIAEWRAWKGLFMLQPIDNSGAYPVNHIGG